MADDASYWGGVDKAAPASPSAAQPGQPTTTNDPYWGSLDPLAPKSNVTEQPPAGGAFRAGVEHAIRSSAPYKWAYEHFPALRQQDQQSGYTPLSDEDYQKRYGANFYANVGQGTGNLLLMAPAIAATEAVGGPLAAYLGSTRLAAAAPQVLREADYFRPAVQSVVGPIREVANPVLAAGVRLGTNALQGLEGAAITGGNLVHGAIAGAAAPIALGGIGKAIDTGAGYIANNPYAQTVTNALLRLGGGLAGLAHGGASMEGLLEAALGGGAGESIAHLMRLGVPIGKAIEALGATTAGPAGAAAGQLAIPSPM